MNFEFNRKTLRIPWIDETCLVRWKCERRVQHSCRRKSNDKWAICYCYHQQLLDVIRQSAPFGKWPMKIPIQFDWATGAGRINANTRRFVFSSFDFTNAIRYVRTDSGRQFIIRSGLCFCVRLWIWQKVVFCVCKRASAASILWYELNLIGISPKNVTFNCTQTNDQMILLFHIRSTHWCQMFRIQSPWL